MARLAFNEMTTYRWTFEEDVHQYAASGFNGIGVWRQKLSDYGEEKGVDLLTETGLAVSSLLWAGGFTGSDGRSHKESVQDAQDAIRLASRLGTDCLVVYTGARAGHTHNHARRLVKTALSELLPFAAEFGITLAIEPMHAGCASEWTFLTSLEDTLNLIEELESPSLKMVFDCYHFGCDEGVLSRVSNLVPRIAIVHLGDGRQPPDGEQNRCRLGDGNLPLSELVAELVQSGYDGFFEVELMGEEIEATDYQDLLSHSKEAFDSWQRVLNQS